MHSAVNGSTARTWRAAAALFCIPCAVVLFTGVPASTATPPTPSVRPESRTSFHAPPTEYRYRITGKLHFGLFTIGRDDVGTGRMAWRSDGSTHVISLLVGSDPQRAPRGVNQWGYLREELESSNQAEVFSLRTLDDDETAPAGGFGVGDGPTFGVSCATFKNAGVSDVRTIVRASGVTYRMFDQLLDRVVTAPGWKSRQVPRPDGAEPGFLTALQHALRVNAGAEPRSKGRQPSVTYVYNSTVYDLTIRGSQALGRTTVGARTFDRLVRTDFAIRNRSTGDITKFGVTHDPDQPEVSLPIQIFYQPSFWLTIELRLDEAAEVPDDPSTDQAVLDRIRSICASAR